MSENQRGAIRLAVTVLLIAGVTALFDAGGPVLVVVAIMAMIMLHEFGHYVTARWAGMRVTDFFLGFGPMLWSVQKGDTRFGVRALPLGGYVRVIGMNNLDPIEDPADEVYTYRSKTWWQKVRFASAGTFMHFVIAFVLMIVLLAGFGLRQATATTTVSEVTPSFTAAGPESPAKAAGVRAGDKILTIADVRIKSWDQVGEVLQRTGGDTIDVTVLRDGRQLTLPVTPQSVETSQGPAFKIGVGPKVEVVTDKQSWPAATWNAAFEVKTLTIESTKALFGIFTPDSLSKYTKQLGERGEADPVEDGNRLLSPVGVFRIADVSAEAGGAAVLTLLISINIFVGIFNMVPLPPFDGGHVMVATYEAIATRITGRRHAIDMAKLLPVAYAVIMALVLLSASALWLDIMRPFNLG